MQAVNDSTFPGLSPSGSSIPWGPQIRAKLLSAPPSGSGTSREHHPACCSSPPKRTAPSARARSPASWSSSPSAACSPPRPPFGPTPRFCSADARSACWLCLRNSQQYKLFWTLRSWLVWKFYGSHCAGRPFCTNHSFRTRCLFSVRFRAGFLRVGISPIGDVFIMSRGDNWY